MAGTMRQQVQFQMRSWGGGRGGEGKDTEMQGGGR